jgi:ribonuclease T1
MTKHAPAPRPSRLRRFLSAAAVVFALTGGSLVAPAVVAPEQTTASADAAVYSTCTLTRCSAARTARTGWSSLGWPTSAGWYAWPYGQYNYTGGTFQNREGQLPANATYSEYDVYSRAQGASRDAYRIVVNRSTRETWFTPDHYVNFYKL